jgi:hypothetical protein
MENREPYDPEDPMDIASDMFRKFVLENLMQAEKVSIFRDLDQQGKMEAFLGGALVGIISAAYAFVTPDQHDRVYEAILEAMPGAKEFADDLEKEYAK